MSLRLTLIDLENVARRAGYAEYKDLLVDWYVVQRLALLDIAERLHVTQQRVRKHLVRFGITIRGKGGANNVKVVLTQALLEEVAKDGIPAVAMRLGVAQPVLYARIRAWIAANPNTPIIPSK